MNQSLWRKVRREQKPNTFWLALTPHHHPYNIDKDHEDVSFKYVFLIIMRITMRILMLCYTGGAV